MPQLIDQETFDKVQQRFKENKRMGPHGASHVDDDEPRYWLTGKLYCGKCKESMHGMCGTGKHGERHYCYACKNHRRRKGSERWCPKRNVRKDFIEQRVTEVLQHILADTENRAQLAVDISSYYREHYVNTHYLDGLRSELKATNKALDNLVRAIEKGLPLTDSVVDRLNENEERKQALAQAIEVEEARSRAAEDEASIQAYFERYTNADFDDAQIRDSVLEYFVDKIYLYDDRIVITGYYSDIHHELMYDELYGDNSDGSSGFIYDENPGSGFVYLADGGT